MAFKQTQCIEEDSQAEHLPGDSRQREDFRLLLALFIFFRLGAVLFFRPGGYIRDYTDLIIYQQRASWQEYGLLPFRDYWSEYPPIFPWLSLLIDRLASQFPAWEDERLWFAAIFGIIMVAAETLTFICLYRLARRTQPGFALRVAWMYALLFLPVYLLGGWFDGLAVMTIFLAMALLLRQRTLATSLLFGFLIGVGGLIKIVPLATLGVTPLAFACWRERTAAIATAIATFMGGYALMAAIGPEMTSASIRSLLERSGWSTVYALISGFDRLGKVVGDPFDATISVALYAPRIPHLWVLAFFGAIGLGLLVAQSRRQRPPQSMDVLRPVRRFNLCDLAAGLSSLEPPICALPTALHRTHSAQWTRPLLRPLPQRHRPLGTPDSLQHGRCRLFAPDQTADRCRLPTDATTHRADTHFGAAGDCRRVWVGALQRT